MMDSENETRMANDEETAMLETPSHTHKCDECASLVADTHRMITEVFAMVENFDPAEMLKTVDLSAAFGGGPMGSILGSLLKVKG